MGESICVDVYARATDSCRFSCTTTGPTFMGEFQTDGTGPGQWKEPSDWMDMQQPQIHVSDAALRQIQVLGRVPNRW